MGFGWGVSLLGLPAMSRGIDAEPRRGAVIQRRDLPWTPAPARALWSFDRTVLVVPPGTPPWIDLRRFDGPDPAEALREHAGKLVSPTRSSGLGAQRSLVGDARDLLAAMLHRVVPDFRGDPPRQSIEFVEGEVPDDAVNDVFTLLVHIGATAQASRMLGESRSGDVAWDGSLEALDGDGYVNCFLMRNIRRGEEPNGREPAHLILAGGSDYGTYFAVSTFLQKHLGVRWLFPGNDGTVFPAAPPAFSDEDLINDFEEPWVRSRTLAGICSNSTHTPAELDAIRAWQLCNRLRPHNDLAQLFQVVHSTPASCSRSQRDDFTAAMLEVEERVPTDHSLHTLLSPDVAAYAGTRELRGRGPAIVTYPELRHRDAPPGDTPTVDTITNATRYQGTTPRLHIDLGSLGHTVVFTRQVSTCVVPSGNCCPATPSGDGRRTQLVASGANSGLVANAATAIGASFSHCALAAAPATPLDSSAARPDQLLRFVPRTFATHLLGDSFTFPNWHPCIFDHAAVAPGEPQRARPALALDLATQLMFSTHGRYLRGRDLSHSVAFCDLDTWCQCDACVRADDNGGPGDALTLYQGQLIAYPQAGLEREGDLPEGHVQMTRPGVVADRTTYLQSNTGGMLGGNARFVWLAPGNPFHAMTFDQLAAYGCVWAQGYPRTRTRRVLTLLNAVCDDLQRALLAAYGGVLPMGPGEPFRREALAPWGEEPVLGFHAYAQYMAPPMAGGTSGVGESCHRFLMPYMTGVRDTLEYEPGATNPYEALDALPPSTEGALARMRAAPDQFNHERWSRIAQRTGLYEYISSAGYVGPHLYTARLHSAIRNGLRHHRLRGFISETSPNWCFDAPMLWELPRVLWDPGPLVGDGVADHLRALRGDFCATAFGVARESMRAFFDLCEEAWAATRDGWKIYDASAPMGRPYPDRRLRSGASSGLCGDGYGGRGARISTLDGFYGAPRGGGARNRLLACWRLLNLAYDATEGDEPTRRRVQLFRRGFGLTLLIGLWYEPVQRAFEMIRRQRTDLVRMQKMTVTVGAVMHTQSVTRPTVSNVGMPPTAPLPTGPTGPAGPTVTVLTGYAEQHPTDPTQNVPPRDLMLAGNDRSIRDAAAARINPPLTTDNGLRSLRNQVHRYLALSHADGASDELLTLQDAAAEIGHLRDVGLGLFADGPSTLADDAPFPNQPIGGPHRLVGLDLPFLTQYIQWWNAIPRNGDRSARERAMDERIQLVTTTSELIPNPGFGWCFQGIREAAGMVAVHGFDAVRERDPRNALLFNIVRG